MEEIFIKRSGSWPFALRRTFHDQKWMSAWDFVGGSRRHDMLLISVSMAAWLMEYSAALYQPSYHCTGVLASEMLQMRFVPKATVALRQHTSWCGGFSLYTVLVWYF